MILSKIRNLLTTLLWQQDVLIGIYVGLPVYTWMHVKRSEFCKFFSELHIF